MRFDSYQNVLENTLQRRCEANPRYSLRSFAKDLGISPASLSLILNRRQGVSAERARRLATSLALSRTEAEWFTANARSQHDRAPKSRKAAERTAKHLVDSRSELGQNRFSDVSRWYYFAILELTEVSGFRSEEKWIARRLSLSTLVVRRALQRLVDDGYLNYVDGVYRQAPAPAAGFLTVSSETPSRAIRSFHSEILAKAERALETEPNDRREFGSLIFSIDDADLEWAKREIGIWRRKLMRRLESRPVRNRLYCLAVQFFALDSVSLPPSPTPAHPRRNVP